MKWITKIIWLLISLRATVDVLPSRWATICSDPSCSVWSPPLILVTVISIIPRTGTRSTASSIASLTDESMTGRSGGTCCRSSSKRFRTSWVIASSTADARSRCSPLWTKVSKTPIRSSLSSLLSSPSALGTIASELKPSSTNSQIPRTRKWPRNYPLCRRSGLRFEDTPTIY